MFRYSLGNVRLYNISIYDYLDSARNDLMLKESSELLKHDTLHACIEVRLRLRNGYPCAVTKRLLNFVHHHLPLACSYKVRFIIQKPSSCIRVGGTGNYLELCTEVRTGCLHAHAKLAYSFA